MGNKDGGTAVRGAGGAEPGQQSIPGTVVMPQARPGHTVAQAALLAAPAEKGSSPRGARPGQRAGTREQESARSKDECSFPSVTY